MTVSQIYCFNEFSKNKSIMKSNKTISYGYLLNGVQSVDGMRRSVINWSPMGKEVNDKDQEPPRVKSSDRYQLMSVYVSKSSSFLVN